MDPYPLINSSHFYNLYLNDEGCDMTSGTLDITILACNCLIKASVLSATVNTTPFINYTVVMNIDNTSGSPMQVTVTLDNSVGVMVPSTVTVPPGGGIFTFTMIPDVSFTGGYGTIRLSGLDGEKHCKNDLEYEFPENPQIPPSPRKGTGELKVFPNPASSEATVAYTLEKLQGNEC